MRGAFADLTRRSRNRAAVCGAAPAPEHCRRRGASARGFRGGSTEPRGEVGGRRTVGEGRGRAAASGQGTIRPDGVAKRGRRRRPARAPGPAAPSGIRAEASRRARRSAEPMDLGPRVGGERSPSGGESAAAAGRRPAAAPRGPVEAPVCAALVGGAGPAVPRRTTSAPPFGGRRVRGTATRGCWRRGPPGRSAPAASRGGAVSETVRAPPTGPGTTARREGMQRATISQHPGPSFAAKSRARCRMLDGAGPRDRSWRKDVSAVFRAVPEPPRAKLRARSGSAPSPRAPARAHGDVADGRRTRSSRPGGAGCRHARTSGKAARSGPLRGRPGRRTARAAYSEASSAGFSRSTITCRPR